MTFTELPLLPPKPLNSPVKEAAKAAVPPAPALADEADCQTQPLPQDDCVTYWPHVMATSIGEPAQ